MKGRSRWWTRTLPVLAAYGLVPGPEGFDVIDLTTLAQQRGWQVSTEHTVHQGSGQRWRATIIARSPTATASGHTLGGTYGHGRTEDEALAIALASMIRRGERLP